MPRIYIYIYIYEEMVDLGRSDKMIKISGKVTKLILITDSRFWWSSIFNKEQNIIESVVRIGLYTFPLISITHTHTHTHTYIYIYIYIYIYMCVCVCVEGDIYYF